MKHFWHGFSKKSAAPVQFKKHVIIIFLAPNDAKFGDKVQRISFKYPSVKVKLIDVSKQPLMPSKHNVKNFPSVLLLKSGKEVDRVTNGSTTMIEQLFRKAHV